MTGTTDHVGVVVGKERAPGATVEPMTPRARGTLVALAQRHDVVTRAAQVGLVFRGRGRALPAVRIVAPSALKSAPLDLEGATRREPASRDTPAGGGRRGPAHLPGTPKRMVIREIETQEGRFPA